LDNRQLTYNVAFHYCRLKALNIKVLPVIMLMVSPLCWR